MIYIDKEPHPPKALSDYKVQNPSATYRQNHNDADFPKAQIKEALRNEQKSLCAYCMTRLSNEDNKTAIEHWVAQSTQSNNGLVYADMLLVCREKWATKIDGKPTHYACEAVRGNRAITVSPLEKTHMATIKYCRDSRKVSISSDNADIETDLNHTLRLNHDELQKARFHALATVQARLKKESSGTASKALILKMMKAYESAEYKGVILWYLNKKLSPRERLPEIPT